MSATSASPSPRRPSSAGASPPSGGASPPSAGATPARGPRSRLFEHLRYRPGSTVYPDPPEADRAAEATERAAAVTVGGWRRASLTQVVTVFASSAAIIGAVLYYLGYVTTASKFRYYGIETSMLGYSVPDYILLSLKSAPLPLLEFVIGCILFVQFHRIASRFVARRRHVARLWLFLRVLGVASTVLLTAVAVAIYLWETESSLLGNLTTERREDLKTFLPYLLFVSVGTLAYSSVVLRQLARRPTNLIELPLMIALALVGLLWAVVVYGRHVGERDAVATRKNLQFASDITLISRDRLALQGPGVRSDALADPTYGYRYRYWGLRILARTPEGYLLVPADWKPSNNRVYLVDPNDNLRLEVTKSTRHP